MFIWMKRLFLLSVLGLGVPSYAQPTTGAYITDPQSEWVQDEATNAVSTPNKLLCFMASTRPDAMVNKGQYLALINESKCDSSRGDASASTNSGGGQSTEYTRMSVTSSRATNSSPQIVKGHAEVVNDEGTLNTYFYGEQTAAPSASAPNGEAFLDYAGATADGLTAMRGKLTVGGTGITFSEAILAQGQTFGTAMKLTVDGDSGSGVVRVPDWNTGGNKTYTIGYDNTTFCRSDGTNEVCFSRKRSDAKKSTWRYGVYNADGSRYDVGTPGFSIKSSTGSYGWANYWGIWLNEGVTDGQALTSGDGKTAYTVKVAKGKLTKKTKVATTLAAISNVPIRAWIKISGNAQENEYQFYWDKSTSKFVVTSENQCGQNGCYAKRVTGTEFTPQEASQLLTVGGNQRDVWGWSDSLGGPVHLPHATIAAGSGAVSYKTREVVRPGDTSVPSSFKCLRNCATSVSLSGFDGTNSPWDFASTFWEVQTSDVKSYTWDAARYEMRDSGGIVGTPSLTKAQWEKGWRWGMNFTLVDGTADLTAVKCPWNNNLCPWKADDVYSTTYQWDMGPNDWNTGTFLMKSDSTYVSFTPPQSATFTVPQDVTKYGEYAGATMNLQYEGFGELHGIPGACFNESDNQPADCGPNTRWVPAFAIADGSSVTIRGETKYVKGLESEIRFARVAGTAAANGVTLGSAADLPATVTINSASDQTDPSNSANSSIYPGSYAGVNFSQEPAVIHGVVQ